MRRHAMTFSAAALASLGLVACVDGTTPDCSDAAARCSPDFDAYPSEGSTDDTSTGDTGAPDTGAADSAPRDAGDAG